jgi:hypothetical protein
MIKNMKIGIVEKKLEDMHYFWVIPYPVYH